MIATVLLELVPFITSVWAGGYQGVLERVLLYYAYEIEDLNPEAYRKLGFACKGEFDTTTKQCPGGWEKTESRGPRATITELVAPLSRLNPRSMKPIGRNSGGNPVPFADGVDGLDAEKTAKYLYPEILKATKSKRHPNGKIPNTPPYKMVRAPRKTTSSS